MLSFCLWLSCRKLNELVSGFPVPSPHHVPLAQPVPLSPALLTAKFMFLREDALVQPLSPLYRGPSLVLEKQKKFYCLQLGDRKDVVSVDRLEPAFFHQPISPALPPLRGRPVLNLVPVPCQPPPPPSAGACAPVPRKTVRFLLIGTLIMLQGLEGSALLFLLGGVLWLIHDNLT